jgi:chemotaxis protein CheX
MMMGMPVDTIDEIAISAIGEFTNMVTGNASITLSNNNLSVDTTPPSVISGKDIFFIISSVETWLLI